MKRNLLIGFIKSLRLFPAKIVQAAVNTATLNNTLQIEIGLPVANDVYFFSDQFLRYFAPLAAGGRKNREILVSTIESSAYVAI